MIDLLNGLFHNAALHSKDAKREDFVLLIGENHKLWFTHSMLPILEYEVCHKAKNHTPDQISGIEIFWTQEYPNMFLFIERKYVEFDNG